MLHESIRDQNEITGNPAPERNCQRGSKMPAWPKSFLAPDKRADERAFKEEREHPFHGQRLPDHTAGIPRKVSPVCSELKLHRNASNDTHCKIEAENLRPKPNR